MKSLSGIVTHSSTYVRTSDVSASKTYHCDFSVGGVEVVFVSERGFDIAVGDLVTAAGIIKANRMTAFSVYDLSTNEQRSSGVISNLFVAAFAATFGLFFMVITSVFLALFSYVISVFTGIAVFYFLRRFFASLIASILVWYRCRHTTKGTISSSE